MARTQTTSYDSKGQFATSSRNALGHTESRLFDPRFGQVSQLTGPNGLATKWQYDSFGRQTKETRADGTYTSYTYQYCGSAAQVTSSPASYAACPALPTAGHTPAYVITQADYAANNSLLSPPKLQYIDALGRTLRSQTQDFNNNTVIVDTQYNSLGQVTAKSQPYTQGTTPIWSRYTYDALGRVLTASSPDSAAASGIATTTTTYSGLATTVTNSQGQTTTTTKNSQGQIASITDSTGSITSYRYDALGQLIQTNAAGSITTLSYNQRGQKIGMIDPAMGVWSYSYNAFGELVSQTDSLAQTSTMSYDALGRMTGRTEPDLVSNWYYDKNADQTACGKSVGKLCQATADNGYKRSHSYDSLGRANSTATLLDHAASPATVSVTFDATTGRLASKTWPTGYTATYSYSAGGYLTAVGSSGARVDILNYDNQGRITSYKQGNNVVTNKTYTADAGRLATIQATLQGATTGAVQNMRYSYDSLSNLKTRVDANTGVSESFSYDSLSRLSLYTELGGSVSPPISIQTQYDARGNISYKSDVGQYWYDAARPNRLVNVTLSAPSGAQPLTGTRRLAYAFDDYLATAATVNGTTLGNGNLMYTVSQDAVNNKHTVRFESYTSFNMPSQIQYANLTLAAAGVTTNGAAMAATFSYTCPAGQTVSGANCLQSITTPSNSFIASYACPSDQVLGGTNCLRTTSTTTPASVSYSCPSWATLSPPWCTYISQQTFEAEGFAATLNYSCPAGTTRSGTNCIGTSTTTSAATPVYSCLAGQTLIGSDASSSCQTTTTMSRLAAIIYACPSGYAVSGSQCQIVSNQARTGTSGTSSDRTLSFVYGPEHQRIKQITTLTGNAPSQYSAGTVWYLNGEDGQSLTYEKEIKTSGVTEHKHYLSAGGMTFALYTQRTGAGVTVLSTTPTAPLVSYQCPSGQTLSGSNCIQSVTMTNSSSVGSYTCPSGQTLSGANCLRTTSTTTPASVSYSCPSWATLSPPWCTYISQQTFEAEGFAATLNYSCPAGTTRSGTNCLGTTTTSSPAAPVYSCPAGQVQKGTGASSTCQVTSPATFAAQVSYICPSGQVLSGSSCLLSVASTSTIGASVSYSCDGVNYSANNYGVCSEPSGFGDSVTTNYFEPYKRYSCPSGYTLSGVNCTKPTTSITTSAATPVYSCLAGLALTGSGTSSQCLLSNITIASPPIYACQTGYGLQTNAQGTTCMPYSRDAKAQQATRYFHSDHLGSISVITDEAGQIVERLAYDPWGKRRHSNGLADKSDSLVSTTTDRGYTAHEHLDEVGVIHMNGRVYDPLMGRFMSADPFIQAPFELQSHNRYAYVMNNPLYYTDPSGYFSLGGFFQGISNIVTSILQPLEPAAKVGVTITAAYYSGQWALGAGYGAMGAGAAGGFAAGFTGSAVNGGNLDQSVKAGLAGGATGAAFGYVGSTYAAGTVGSYAGHGVVGCVSSVASGGKCGSGGAAAVFGKWATNSTANWGAGIAQGAAAAVAGGVGSVMGGGKFENGARTAAFGYLFNRLMHDTSRINGEKFKLSNPNAMDELIKLNSAIVNLGYADDSFTIRITGGDRYVDANGVIRSATDDSVIAGAATNSKHLISQGARGIDVSVSGVATADFQRALAITNLTLLNVTYADKHLHLDLPTSKWFAPRRP